MTLWLIIIGMGLVTYAIRLSPIVLLERVDIPPVIRRALRFVPVEKLVEEKLKEVVGLIEN